MARINSFIFSAFVYCISATLVFAQSAALLPNAQQVYLDANGNPLSTGTVGFYYPSTLNLKPIWQDATEATPYTNPVTLNSAGRPPGSQGIYGQGAYRQIVKDVNGVTIWDALTSSAGSSSGVAATGDGDLVGTIKPWAGITAPNQYQFAYGQQLNRTTFAALFTAITQSLAVTCTSASNTLSGIADTTSINVGAPLEAAACVVPGTTVSSKTSSTVVMSNPSSVNLNTTAVFFPFGNGDGSTTFTLPDFRGNTIAGRPNMGGTASTNLTNCNAGQGTTCGTQNTTLARANLPNVTYSPVFTGTLNPAATVNVNQSVLAQTGGGTVNAGINTTINSITATVTVPAFTPAGTINTFPLNGGITQTAFSTVQPTITLNYIIKVTADTNSAIATGVTDINGMVGSIACGAGLSCTGNIISTTTAATCAVSGAFIIYNATTGLSVCSTIGGTGSLAIINGTLTTNTSGTARSLNAGSNFAAAQPAVFNVNDNQAPADFRMCYFGVSVPGGATNAGFINASCGTSGNPINWAGGSTSVFSSFYDTGVAGRSYNGEWHNYTVSAGTGGTTQSVLINCTLGGTWTPSGTSGCVGANTYANTTVGGFTWGITPAAAASGVTAANIVGAEADTQYAAGAGGNKVGIQIVDQLNNTTGTSTAAAVNTAFQIICVTSSYCWDTGIFFPAATGTTIFGMRATGTLIKSAAGTFAHGIDLSAGTCSTDCFKSNGYAVDGSGNITGLYDTGGAGNTFKIAGTAAGTVAQIQGVLSSGLIKYAFRGVNFNQTNTDNAITFTLPTGVTRYAVQGIRISAASTSISTATVGVFTSTGGGGQTIAANQAITVTQAGADTNNNTMGLTLTNAATEAYTDTTLQVRNGTAQGGAATADIILLINPL